MQNPLSWVYSLVMTGIFLVAGCAMHPSGPQLEAEAVRQALVARLGTEPEQAILGQAAVETPEGLWNVYVISVPPDRVAVHQVRQRSEIRFGLTREHLWSQDAWTGEARWLPEDFRFFIRNHELLRLGDRLGRWRAVSWGESDEVEGQSCTRLELTDELGNAVDLCLDADGLPVAIRLVPPPAYGDSHLVVYPRQWREVEGRTFLAVYELNHGTDRYHWNFQGIESVDRDSVRIEPPDALTSADPGP